MKSTISSLVFHSSGSPLTPLYEEGQPRSSREEFMNDAIFLFICEIKKTML